MTWSNGTAVNASDIATWLSPSYALNPQYDFVGLHTEVTGVRIVNSDTAVINLNTSDAQLPNRIGTYYYAPLVSPSDVARGPADPLFTNPAVAERTLVTSELHFRRYFGTIPAEPVLAGPKPVACALDIIFVENSASSFHI